MRRVAILLVLLSAWGLAQQAGPIGVISSRKPITVDGTDMPPTGSASYPVVEHDEITTQAPTLLTANDHSIAVLDTATRVKIDLLAPSTADSLAAPGHKLFYIFLRQGGMTFDAKGGRMYVCAAGRLFVPEFHSKGSLRMNASGTVTMTLSGGVFAEQGKRGCSETGIAGVLSGLSGAQVPGGAVAGGVIAPASAGVSAVAISAGAVGIGLGAAAGASAFSSSSLNCATAGCNTIPGAVSASQP